MHNTRIIPSEQANEFRPAPSHEFSHSNGPVYGRASPYIEGQFVKDEMPQPIHPVSKETYQDLAKQNPDARSETKPQPVADEPPAEPQPSVEEQLEVEKAQAREEGLRLGMEEGHKLGLEDGKLKAEEMFSEQIKALQTLLDELETRVTAKDQELESELSELAASMARRVLQRELHIHPNHILHAVQQGLAALPSQQGHVRLFLHPDDLSNINQNLLKEDHEHTWSLQEDPEINKGSYRLESGSAELSLNLEKRLEEVIDAALSDHNEADHG